MNPKNIDIILQRAILGRNAFNAYIKKMRRAVIANDEVALTATQRQTLLAKLDSARDDITTTGQQFVAAHNANEEIVL